MKMFSLISLIIQMKSPGVRQDWVVELRLARLVSFSVRIIERKHLIVLSGSRPKQRSWLGYPGADEVIHRFQIGIENHF